MPILDISPVDDALPTPLAAHLANAPGAALNANPGTLWITLHRVPRAQYAENGIAPAATPATMLVPQVLARADNAALDALAAHLTTALATAAGRDPAHVHLTIKPAAGRIAVGGAEHARHHGHDRPPHP